MALQIPLGVSEFREIREQRLTYVDKSLLVRDVIADTAKVLLLPRPRRFGKTLNLSMLRTFFERSAEPLWPLFEDLAIARAGDEVRSHFQRYPTIALTFKDVKAPSWQSCRDAMASVIALAYREHDYLLTEGSLRPAEVDVFDSILRKQASDAEMWESLARLARYLHQHHGERVLILVDEYDTPIHAGWVSGYYDEVIAFFRNFFSGGLKDNPSLYKGVLTGILRVAKDSVFTGLNNIEVYSLLRSEYNEYFGFTESEVAALLETAGEPGLLGDIQRWYNGYVFGGRVIYNPWSVMAYLKSADRELRAHWVETSSNDLVRELMFEHGLGFQTEMEQLLRGEEIERPVVEHVALRELRGNEALAWSLLLHTGYLKVLGQRRENRVLWCRLAVPNQEVLSIYETLLADWTRQGLGGDTERREFLAALLRGDADQCQRFLQDWFLANVSLHDTARHRPPERFYHGFVLGLLVSLGDRYEVRSNQESGYGRCDVMVVPREAGRPGVAIELKVRDVRRGETVDQAFERGFRQLQDRRYAESIRARGAAPVHELVFVFDGKQVDARAGAAGE